jgi:hypothetical protein
VTVIGEARKSSANKAAAPTKATKTSKPTAKPKTVAKGTKKSAH